MTSPAITLILAAAWLSAYPPQAAHAQRYPSRPVRIIVPHAAGGPYDATARGAAQFLSQSFGQQFVVENRPTANGIIGAQSVAKSPPDGHTLMVTSSSTISMNPFAYANLPYDPPRDFAPVIRMGSVHSFILVHPSVPVASLRELVDLAKAKPGTVTWSNWGSSSLSNLYTEWLVKARGISFYAVPYKSATQALNAVMAGDVQVAMYAIGQALPQVKAGKLKALAVTGGKRSVFAPEMPTLKETGAGIDLEIPLWLGLFSPSGTPKEIVAVLNAEVGKLLLDREFRGKFLLARGIDPDEPASVEAFAEFLRRDRATYENLAKITGIKAD